MSALALTFEKLPRSQISGSVDCVARVCSSWAQAAAAATRSFKSRIADTDSLQRWLHSRGASVRRMGLIQSSGVITTLPCPKLEDLMLAHSSVDLRPGSQLLQDLCSATALTRLWLIDVTYQGEPDLAAVLLALPSLQEFSLLSVGQEGYIKVQDSPQQRQQQLLLLLHANPANEAQDSHEPSQQLWSAHGDPLDGYRCFTDSGMQVMCKLTKLHLLELSSLQGVTVAGLADLHKLRELKKLYLEDLTCDISLSAVPAFSQLTHLTGLTLSWAWDTPHCGFDPSILAHTMQLEKMAINFCTPARGAAGAAELLCRLAQLPKLRKLNFKWINGLQQCPPEAFSALTSSSVLESLTWEVGTPAW